MRISLNRITKDLRQATDFNSDADAEPLDVDTYLDGRRSVSYTTSTTGTLTRSVTAATPIVMHKELTDDNIFTYPVDAESPDTVNRTRRQTVEPAGHHPDLELRSRVRNR